MINGLKALFSSGLIFNPFVILGTFYGFYLTKNYPVSEIYFHYKQYQLYLLILILSFLYNIFFKKHLKNGGLDISWQDTTIASTASFFKFFIASIVVISFTNFFFF